MLKRLVIGMLNPSPLRACTKALIRSLRLGSFGERAAIGAVARPGYAYCMYYAADLAKRLGKQRISVLELGVAGGNGLLALERHAVEVEKELSIKIDVVGFDTGGGLPQPVDHRDLPYIWQSEFFKIDVDALKRRLSRAELILGDIAHTLPAYLRTRDDSSVGAIMIDVDYYSSTISALAAIAANSTKMLPRSFLYFDDVVGDHHHLYNQFTGELAAISDFNSAQQDLKIASTPHLSYKAAFEPWSVQVYVLHAFQHALYNQFVGHSQPQLPIK